LGPETETTLAALEAIGLGTLLLQIPYYTDEPKVASFFCQSPKRGRYSAREPYGLCLDFDASTARMKALAECYERICLHNCRYDTRPGPWRDSGRRLDPAIFALPADHKNEARLEEISGAAYHWIAACDIITGQDWQVPVQVVRPGFGESEDVAILPKVGSSGAALGPKGSRIALHHALFEVVERTSHGSLFQSSPRDRITALPQRFDAMLGLLERYRLEPFVFLLPNSLNVPCVLVVTVDRSGVGPAMSHAGRAAPTFGEAMEAALLESIERRRPARLEQSSRFWKDVDPRPRAKRTYSWPTLADLESIEPKFIQGKSIEFDELEGRRVSLDDLIERLRKRGDQVLVCDMTLPEVGRAGFEALRVLVPSLGPLPV